MLSIRDLLSFSLYRRSAPGAKREGRRRKQKEPPDPLSGSRRNFSSSALFDMDRSSSNKGVKRER